VAIGHPIEAPVFDTATLSAALFGMLGLGSMRSWEKAKGVADKH